MKRSYVPVLLVILCGCVSVESVPEGTASAGYSYGAKANLTNIRQITVGMTQQEMEEVMGDHTNIGFKASHDVLGAYETMTLTNPYRAETVQTGEKKYEVMYYFTSVKNPDGFISDEELTPLVFENGKLIGKGHDFLFRLKEKL